MTKGFYRALIFWIIFFTAVCPASAFIPTDPLYPQQPYLERLNSEKAWDVSRGDGTVVAVLDSGVDIYHPDLKDNIWFNPGETAGDNIDNDRNGYIDDVNGWDFVTNQADPRPKFSENYSSAGLEHGTAIAGVIAAKANNSQGITGLAFDSKIMPLRILDADGTGDVSNLVKAISYAVDNGADVINLSLVGYDYSQELFDVIKMANARGAVVVAAAGNAEDGSLDGINLDNKPAYPVCYGNNTDNNLVISVSSLDNDKKKSTFANYGRCVDLSVFGEGITSLSFYYPDKGLNDYYYYNWNGTSFATALVSGAAALVKSKNKQFTAAKVANALMSTTDDVDVYNPQYRSSLGSGILDILKAVNYTPPASPGRLIKLKDSKAVYYVDTNNTRHLFSNESVYWSWYSGNWSDQKIDVISQGEMDGLRYGSNMTIRPGTNLVRFGNSNKMYVVSSGSRLQEISDVLARQIFGGDYQQRLVRLSDGFAADYFYGAALTEARLPDGFLIQFANAASIWYLENGQKRKLSGNALADNSFKEYFIVKNVATNVDYPDGAPINDWEEKVFPFLK